LGAYAFAEVAKEVKKLRGQGIDPIDFGVGDPQLPTPTLVREACQEAVDMRASAGYPPYDGTEEFRSEVAGWFRRRFDVQLDPETEVASTIGSKEGIFNFAEAFVNPGDMVIVPTPGYPPYGRGTRFAEGIPWFIPILPENDFLPDLEAIPEKVREKAKILWINYPNSPSGRVAPAAFFEQAVAFCRRHDILLASDEAYTEIYFGEKPHSALEFGLENVVVVNSMSKRSAMTGYRVGFVAGDAEAVAAFKKVKTNIDSGTPFFVQDAAVAALRDEAHVEAMREGYRRRRDLLLDGFARLGLEKCVPDATLYIWQKVPMDAVEFCKRLLRPKIAIVATPGDWISDLTDDGCNPGSGFVRFALVPSEDDVTEAADRIAKMDLD
jgi:LL-diaminopimelate aminotransferase